MVRINIDELEWIVGGDSLGAIQQGYTSSKDDFVERAPAEKDLQFAFQVRKVRKKEHHFFLGCMSAYVFFCQEDNSKNTTLKSSAI